MNQLLVTIRGTPIRSGFVGAFSGGIAYSALDWNLRSGLLFGAVAGIVTTAYGFWARRIDSFAASDEVVPVPVESFGVVRPDPRSWPQRVRVANVWYLVLQLTFVAHLVAVLSTDNDPGLLILTAVVGWVAARLSAQVAWSFAVEPGALTIQFGPGGLVRRRYDSSSVVIDVVRRPGRPVSMSEIRVRPRRGVGRVNGIVVGNDPFARSADANDVVDMFRDSGFMTA